ncbi:MAG: hypothetical protein RL619_1967 [Bacteroidota bacterium]
MSQNSLFMYFLFWYFQLINLVAFSIIGVDKWLAKQQKWRISERNLLLTGIIGGTIGSGLGILFFRHKTSKISFLWKFFLIVLIQILVIYFLFLTNIFKL